MPSPSRIALVFGAGLLAFLTACSETPDPAPRVADADTLRSLPAGKIVGFAAEYDSHAWLGVPFARPPVGELRWKAPQAPAPWVGTREALEAGAPCVQIASPVGGVSSVEAGQPAGSEDCLTLDVYAPRFGPSEVPKGDARLPVMVWIHGGGNTVGSAGLYNGGHLAASEQVIVVVLQYRLGPFGWLRHASLRGEGTTAAERSGNYGILDQIRALEWIRANIEGFGGDPQRVTIFGESAGGRDVAMLLLSPQATGLFQRAIVESGGTGSISPSLGENWTDDAIPGAEHSSNEILAKRLVADGTAADREAARSWLATRDDPEIAAYLRGQDAYTLLEAYRREDILDGIRLPQVFADGYVLPRQDALGRFARGAYNHVPVVFGTNRDEQRLFLSLNPAFATRRFGLVPVAHDPDRFFSLAEHLSALWKATGADEPAIALQASQPGKVWVYRFDWDEELSLPFVRLDRMLGASHGFEIPFVFGHFDLGPEAIGLFTPFNRSARRELSAKMRSYWAEFAYTGDPGRGRDGSLPVWQPWDDSTPDAHRYVILDTADGGGVRMGSKPVTVASVVADVARDERLRDSRERCGVYRELAAWAWSRGFGPKDYGAIAECAAFPYEAFPWPEPDEATDASADRIPNSAETPVARS